MFTTSAMLISARRMSGTFAARSRDIWPVITDHRPLAPSAGVGRPWNQDTSTARDNVRRTVRATEQKEVRNI